MISGDIDWRCIWWLLKKLVIKMKSVPGIQLLSIDDTERTSSQQYTNILTHMCLFMPCFKESGRSLSIADHHMKKTEIKYAHVK